MALPEPRKSTASHFYKYSSPANLGWLKDILHQHEIYLPNLTQLNDDNDGLPRPGPHGIDAIIVGYHGDGGLTYVARIRNGFVPASRRQVFEKLRPLARVDCPFVNLPETRQTRWGEALTTEKMKKCIWVNPELVAQIEFLEWTESDHLRHSKFIGLREDKDACSVIKEHSGGE